MAASHEYAEDRFSRNQETRDLNAHLAGVTYNPEAGVVVFAELPLILVSPMPVRREAGQITGDPKNLCNAGGDKRGRSCPSTPSRNTLVFSGLRDKVYIKRIQTQTCQFRQLRDRCAQLALFRSGGKDEYSFAF